MTESILEKQNNLVAEFKTFSSWEERYKKIIEMGKALPNIEEEYKIDKYRVKGCQSQVWLVAKMNNDTIDYKIDSDAMIVRGLAAILQTVFSGHTPKDVANASIDFLQEIGLTSHLSQSRANGLASMVKQFKNYALVLQMTQNS